MSTGALMQWLKLSAWEVGLYPAVALKFQRNKMFFPLSLLKVQYCGHPTWPRSSVLSLRSPSSGCFLDQFSLHVHNCGYSSIHSFIHSSISIHAHVYIHIPANMSHWTNVGLMLGHRLRRWTNIKPTFWSFLSNHETLNQYRLEVGPTP